ncbi:CENP-S associating centromere protein X-domain-containing protein [Terfezia claveryi]|nr:CENP-S associating centromere protein X-domain-containing protein [Terfezia claveryi]
MPPKSKPTNASRKSASTTKSKPTLSPPSPPPHSPSPQPPAASPEASQSAQIPPQLLSRILHEFFAGQSGYSSARETRISNAAVAAVGEYTRTFVREAIHRAAAERVKEEAKRAGGMNDTLMIPEVEVGDLEKVGPQLVLDF